MKILVTLEANRFRHLIKTWLAKSKWNSFNVEMEGEGGGGATRTMRRSFLRQRSGVRPFL